MLTLFLLHTGLPVKTGEIAEGRTEVEGWQMNRKSIKCEKCAVFLIALFYISTNSFWGYRLFHDSDAFAAAACLLPMGLYGIHYYAHRTRIWAGTLLSILAMFLIIILRSSFSFKCILFYGMCMLLLIDTKIAQSDQPIRYFYWFSLIFAAGSLFYVLFPQLYKTLILPAFSGSNQYANLIKWSRKESYFIVPGFTNQTSFNACHFVYGIGYLICCRFAFRKMRKKGWMVLLLLSVCLVMTNKRAHLLFSMLALVVVYYSMAGPGERGKRVAVLFFGGLVAVGVLYVLIMNINIGVFIKLRRMLSDLDTGDDISSGRFNLYLLAIKHFVQNPLFGIGWERFRLIPELARELQTHNIYLELLCETGLIGFCVFIAFFWNALRIALRNCRGAASPQEKMRASFCLYMQVFFLLYGLTGNPLYDPPYYIPYFIACAYSFSMKLQREELLMRERTGKRRGVCSRSNFSTTI